MIFYLRRNWFLFLVATFFSILVILPRIISLQLIPIDDFKGIYPMFVDDEGHYEARINSVINNGILGGNPYIFEHRDDVFTQSFFPEWILSLLVKIFGLSIPLAVIFGLSIFLFLDFLLTYAIIFELTKNNKISILYTSLFYFLFINSFGRPINPHINFFVLLSGILIGIYIYRSNLLNIKSTFLNLFMGFVCGISLFLSPYYWSTLLLFYFSLILSRIVLERKFKQYFLSVFCFLITFILFLIPFLYFSIIASRQVGYEDSVLHLGLLRTHWPGSLTNIVITFLPATCLYFLRKDLKKEYFYFALILLSNILILNWQNLVTGIYLQFSSHYLLISFLYTIILLSILHKKIFVINPSKTISKKIFFIFFTALAMLLCLQGNEIIRLLSNKYEPTKLVELQKKQEIFDWFKSNTSKDSVVYVLGGDYESLIPIYTKNKVYYNFYASIFPITNKEIEDRWIVSNFFNDNFNEEFISKNHRWLWMNLFIDRYYFDKSREKIFGLFFDNKKKDFVVDPIMVDGVYKKYQIFRGLGFSKVMKMYKIDYILLDPTYYNYNEIKLELSKIDGIEESADINGVIIFTKLD